MTNRFFIVFIIFATALLAPGAHGQDVKVDRAPDGTVNVIPIVNGVAHGTGVRREPDGTVQVFPLVNGKRTGVQVGYEPDGTVVVFPLVNGKRHGVAVLRDPDGTVTEFHFANGSLCVPGAVFDEARDHCIPGPEP